MKMSVHSYRKKCQCKSVRLDFGRLMRSVHALRWVSDLRWGGECTLLGRPFISGRARDWHFLGQAGLIKDVGLAEYLHKY